MAKHIHLLIILLSTLYSNAPEVIQADEYKLIDQFPKITFKQPLDFQTTPQTALYFIVEQGGKIFTINYTAPEPIKKEFLDISDRLVSGGERGLLGLAFHPQFNKNQLFFVHYSRKNDGATVISRFKAQGSDLQLIADKQSEAILLTVPQPYSNHNGGTIAFGPDGYLYIGLGDGGSAGDPKAHGQNRETLLGSILRINVDTPASDTAYSIPNDNPFVDNKSGYRKEIYAYGLRNPWKFSFDKVTGELWTGDVGQNRWEEVNIVEPGGNYGWNVMEGTDCFSPPSGCKTEGFILPVTTYGRSDGISITGGFVYRGEAMPQLVGRYLFGDYGSGRIWSIKRGERARLLIDSSLSISSFGLDEKGELYVIDHQGGKLYKLSPGS